MSDETDQRDSSSATSVQVRAQDESQDKITKTQTEVTTWRESMRNFLTSPEAKSFGATIGVIVMVAGFVIQPAATDYFERTRDAEREVRRLIGEVGELKRSNDLLKSALTTGEAPQADNLGSPLSLQRLPEHVRATANDYGEDVDFVMAIEVDGYPDERFTIGKCPDCQRLQAGVTFAVSGRSVLVVIEDSEPMLPGSALQAGIHHKIPLITGCYVDFDGERRGLRLIVGGVGESSATVVALGKPIPTIPAVERERYEPNCERP